MKKLYRSRDERMIAGVCGGIGEYFDIDPVILRIVWILLVVFTAFAPGIIAYFFAVLIVPKKSKSVD